MAPTVADQLEKRYYSCSNGYYYSNGWCYTAWDWYGRWIFLGVVIFVVLALFFLWACVNNRRRRRQGLNPMYGTSWMAPGYNNQNYNNPAGYNPPPPAYGANAPGQSFPMQNQYTGNTFNRAEGYYGNHEGVQAPKNIYSGPQNEYVAPAGPPPGK